MALSPSPAVTHRPCSRCGRHPALDVAPFCAACLLTPLGATASPPPTGLAHHHLLLPPGTVVGRYVTGEFLGEGGFAEVYSASPVGPAANDDAPAPVALKVIKRGMDSREILARFRAEQRTIQHLAHPGIVPLLDAGATADGLPYFAMAQVDGLPITDHCEVADLPLRERLALFLTLCDAVLHAHQRGILHRDLKPSNILVEETADGPVPRVIDFGIAKALEPGQTGDTHVTRLGQVMGTPAYMSPEQAAGSDDADTRSDLYALGAVLYEMLTGQPAFAPETLARLPPAEWSRHLRETLPPLVSARLASVNGPPDRVRALRGDLDQVVRKAMAPDPAARYPSVALLADDIARWLTDRPVSARPPSFRKQLRQLVRRHRWPVALGVSLLAGALATAAVGTVLAVQARRAEDRALTAERRAETDRDHAEARAYQAAIEVATMQLAQGEPALAAGQLRATPPALRGWEWGWLMAATSPPEAAAESGLAHAGPLAATPDGHFAALAAGNTLRVVDVPKQAVLLTRAFPGRLTRLALSADGLRLAAVETRPEGEFLHVSRPDGREPWTRPVGGLTDIAWEPPATGGALLLVSGYGPTPAPGRLARLDPATGRVLNERVITRFKAHPRSLFVGPAGRLAVAENSYKDLEIFALPGLEIVGTATDPQGEGVDAVLLDDRRETLLLARGAHLTRGPARDFHPTAAGELLTAGADPAPAQVRHLNWLPDGRWLAAGEHRYLVENGTPAPRPAAGTPLIVPLTGGRHLAALPDGRLEIRPELPAPARPGERPYFASPAPEGRAVAFSPDSRQAFYQPWRRNALEAVPLPADDAPAPAPRRLVSFPEPPDAEWCALPAVHPDGTVLLTTGDTLAALRPDAANTDPVPHAETPWSAVPSPDGRQLAVAVPTGVRLLDWPTGHLRREWPLPHGPFRVLAVRPEGTVLALGADAVLHHLPVAPGRAPAAWPLPLVVNGYRPAPVAFHPGRDLLAAALADGGYAVYDLRPCPAAPPRLEHREPLIATVTALAFTPDARRLAVAGDDHRLTLWDWPQALPLLGFPLNNTCASVAFSPDGHWLAHTDYAPSLVLRHAPPPPHANNDSTAHAAPPSTATPSMDSSRP